MRKQHWILPLIFLIVVGFRLFFAFQSPYFNYEGYYGLRQVENIAKTGIPLYNDELSYGGKISAFPPFFYYFLALFNLFMPINLVGKILPNIFASLLIFAVYLIVKDFTKNANVALLTSFFAGFIPIFVSGTVNNSSPYSLTFPLMFFAMYSLIKIDEKNHMYIFIILMIILTLTSAFAFLFVGGLMVYLLLLRTEGIKQIKSEPEIIMLTVFLVVWIEFLIFKNAFLANGIGIIGQNIPSEIISNYFGGTTILDTIYALGLLPFIFGIYMIYKITFKEKERDFYLMVGFSIVTFLALWFKIIPLTSALMSLGIVLTILFGQFCGRVFDYIEKTRVSRYKFLFFIALFTVFIATSVLASAVYSNSSSVKVPSKEEIAALEWLKENSKESEVILASLDEGSLIVHKTGRKNVIDSDFLFSKNPEQRLKDVKILYTTYYETDALSLSGKYGINYIYFSKEALKNYKMENIAYVSNEQCFDPIYLNEKIKIYRILCKLEEIR